MRDVQKYPRIDINAIIRDGGFNLKFLLNFLRKLPKTSSDRYIHRKELDYVFKKIFGIKDFTEKVEEERASVYVKMCKQIGTEPLIRIGTDRRIQDAFIETLDAMLEFKKVSKDAKKAHKKKGSKFVSGKYSDLVDDYHFLKQIDEDSIRYLKMLMGLSAKGGKGHKSAKKEFKDLRKSMKKTFKKKKFKSSHDMDDYREERSLRDIEREADSLFSYMDDSPFFDSYYDDDGNRYDDSDDYEIPDTDDCLSGMYNSNFDWNIDHKYSHGPMIRPTKEPGVVEVMTPSSHKSDNGKRIVKKGGLKNLEKALRKSIHEKERKRSLVDERLHTLGEEVPENPNALEEIQEAERQHAKRMKKARKQYKRGIDPDADALVAELNERLEKEGRPTYHIKKKKTKDEKMGEKFEEVTERLAKNMSRLTDTVDRLEKSLGSPVRVMDSMAIAGENAIESSANVGRVYRRGKKVNPVQIPSNYKMSDRIEKPEIDKANVPEVKKFVDTTEVGLSTNPPKDPAKQNTYYGEPVPVKPKKATCGPVPTEVKDIINTLNEANNSNTTN